MAGGKCVGQENGVTSGHAYACAVVSESQVRWANEVGLQGVPARN